MKRALVLAALAPLASCVVHVHIHEAPKPEKPPEAAAAPAPSPQVVDSASGIVVDEQGNPLRARVAAITDGGSMSCGTGADGRFDLSNAGASTFLLHVSTKDDRIAIQPDVRAGATDLRLVVKPGAVTTVKLGGSTQARCALFRDGTRVEDFTIHPDKPARVVLPPGDVRVRIYDAKKVLGEQTIHLEVGAHETVEFSSAS